ncbi:S8 family serine peptidase, partial [Kitasatospora sp. NPDC059571]|uniref:S8 family serine peptidase n=1 Tax=Kitasatospora sp. NPDC059571 TaxID=3346871 RepID=UPI003680D2C1
MKPSMHAALTLATAGVLSLAVLPSAGAAPAATAAPTRTAAPARASVTLITGDKVLVQDPQGAQPRVSVTPAAIPGRSVFFSTTIGSDHHVSVVPSDAAALLGSVLDPKLFDVSALIRAGYDDAHTAALPLLVQHAPGAGLPADGSLHTVRELAGLHATAVRQSHGAAATGLGAALTAAGRAALAARSAAPAKGITAGPLAGVTHIWLDAPVHAAPFKDTAAKDTAAGAAAKGTAAKATAAKAAADPALDWNLTRIGAPEAWAAGVTGKGVTVAVIDSGIDTGHPDLADAVAASANFTDAPDTGDHVGSGTHVAGTIAGSGAAADGRRKGIAYDARLLNVKVADDQGNGTLSGLIAGMEWAAAHGARIADVGVFTGMGTDGKDPLSQSVDQLTDRYGTLFVAPVGDFAGETVGAPAAAEQALAVGATDAGDQVPMWSSSGPRTGDFGLKPDLAAPGAAITGAHAAGTDTGPVVDGQYTTLSSTLLAASHAAGAAALLAGAHPDWGAARLKAVLQQSTDDQGTSAYRVGAGRLDAARALRQQVVADRGTFDFGAADCTARTPMTRQVTLTNTGSTDTTLTLGLHLADVRGNPAPDGLATLGNARVAVPAGGSATVTLVVDPRVSAAAPGPYSGRVVATPVGGGASLDLAVAFWSMGDYCPVHLSGLDREGRPGTAGVRFMDLENGDFGDTDFDASGTTLYVKNGASLSLMARMGSVEANGRTAATLLTVPQITVNGATDVVFDARKGKPFSASVPGGAAKTDVAALGAVRSTTYQGINLFSYLMIATSAAAGGDGIDLYAGQATDTPATTGRLETLQYARLNDAVAANRPWTASTVYDLGWTGPSFPGALRHDLTAKDVRALAEVETEQRQPGALGDRISESRSPLAAGSGNTVLVTFPEYVHPGHRTEYLSPGVDWMQSFSVQASFDARTALFGSSAPVRYRTGEHLRQAALGGPLTSTATGLAEDPATGYAYLTMNDLADSAGNSLTGYLEGQSEPWTYARSATLLADGQVVAHTPYPGIDTLNFRMPQGRTTWTLVRGVTMPILRAAGTQARTTWTYRTDLGRAGHGPLVLPLLDLGYRTDLDTANDARAGRPLRIGFDAHRAPGAAPSRVTSLQASWSTDGGATWHQLHTTRTGDDGGYEAVLPAEALRAGGTVALHVTAADDGGSTVDQVLPTGFHVAG